jgi:hypothetical protein
VEDFRQVLIDRCGVDESRLHVCIDPRDPRAFDELLSDVAGQAEEGWSVRCERVSPQDG